MLTVYEYESAASFLKDSWEQKRVTNPQFSLRSWAKKMGFRNNAPLSLMLGGKRPIPKKYVPVFVSDLGLSVSEGLYLETLIAFSNARSLREKEYFVERLRALTPRPSLPFVMKEVETFKYLGNPLHMLILEMCDLPGFLPEPEWIQAHIRIPATVAQIEAAIDRLFALKLLVTDEKGEWKKSHLVLTNRPDIADKGAQEYHRNVSLLASEEVSTQSVDAREYNGYAMNIRCEDLAKAKRLIREFAKNFLEQIPCADRTGDQTYQLNVQFFSLTKEHTPREKS